MPDIVKVLAALFVIPVPPSSAARGVVKVKLVALAAPKVGVINVGLVLNTILVDVVPVVPVALVI